MRIGFNACIKENGMCVQPVDPSSASEGSATLCALNVNAVIQEHEGYIRKLAYQFIPRQVICADVLDLEIDELVQTVCIKFWLALSRQKIDNYKSYLRRMVHNEAVNIQRSSRFHQFLDTDEEGEPYYGNVLLSPNEGTLDPVDIVTEKETISEYIHQAVDSAMDFPPLQRKALLCLFKDRIDYVHELFDALRIHHVDLKQLNWSRHQGALHSMKVSASLAKKKLRALQKASLEA
jgi:RNA polymerase sigma factor (sigma-70 family)